jgi:hypothetical protein
MDPMFLKSKALPLCCSVSQNEEKEITYSTKLSCVDWLTDWFFNQLNDWFIFWGGVRILFRSQDFKIFNSTDKFFWFVNGRCTVLISAGKTTVLTEVFVLSLSFNKFQDSFLRCHNSYLTVPQLILRCHNSYLTVPQLIYDGATTHI